MLHRLLESFPNGSVNVFDKELRYLLAEGAGLQQVGLSSETLVGRTLDEVFGTDAVDVVRPFYERAFRGEPVHFDLDVAGQTFLINAAPLQDGSASAIIVVAQNITDKKRDEEALKQRTQELAESNSDLQQFAYIAGHDLQEPLRTIVNLAQMLERRVDGTLDKDTESVLRCITAASLRMESLIQALTAYARVLNAPDSPAEQFALRTAVDWAVLNLEAAIAETGASVTCDNLPVITGDQTQFTQLFQNLISNAIKYRKPDDPPHVHISAVHSPDGDCIVAVRDNGIGIDGRYADKIFGAFQRLHGRNIPGTGIGLAICKRIVERHQGRIWVESAPGVGSTFSICLRGDISVDGT
ncbi:MAG TPA: ATP-binding protein [Bryobacteraceae bacterium]|nr:ATP-binding protein [Bryobacteraceae bacterium]